jgi:hypothetical protein
VRSRLTRKTLAPLPVQTFHTQTHAALTPRDFLALVLSSLRSLNAHFFE